MFFLFIVFVITLWDSKTSSIFFISIFSGRKVNVVGTLEGVKSKKFPIIFQRVRKKEIREEWEFLRKDNFVTKLILFFLCNTKNKNCKYMTFSHNDFITIFLHHNIFNIFWHFCGINRFKQFLVYFFIIVDNIFFYCVKKFKNLIILLQFKNEWP